MINRVLEYVVRRVTMGEPLYPEAVRNQDQEMLSALQYNSLINFHRAGSVLYVASLVSFFVFSVFSASFCALSGYALRRLSLQMIEEKFFKPGGDNTALLVRWYQNALSEGERRTLFQLKVGSQLARTWPFDDYEICGFSIWRAKLQVSVLSRGSSPQPG